MSAPNPYTIKRLKMLEKLEVEGPTSLHIVCNTIVTMTGDKQTNTSREVKLVFSGEVSKHGGPTFKHDTEWEYKGTGSDLWDSKLQSLMGALDEAQKEFIRGSWKIEYAAKIDDCLSFGFFREAKDAKEYIEIFDATIGIPRRVYFESYGNIRRIHGILVMTSNF